ncbi:MAG: NUDIX domain-containing protein [Chitinophagales bacterium]
MAKPITPLLGCDVFVVNKELEVLLIRRTDNGRWAMPGGCNDLGETPSECAIRECKEETGFEVKILDLIGVWSSIHYEYVYYPWKENEFVHLVFRGEIVGGKARTSSESDEIAWFKADNLPPLSDGHETRIKYGFEFLENNVETYFE